jgi:hypothetical protein
MPTIRPSTTKRENKKRKLKKFGQASKSTIETSYDRHAENQLSVTG